MVYITVGNNHYTGSMVFGTVDDLLREQGVHSLEHGPVKSIHSAEDHPLSSYHTFIMPRRTHSVISIKPPYEAHY